MNDLDIRRNNLNGHNFVTNNARKLFGRISFGLSLNKVLHQEKQKNSNFQKFLPGTHIENPKNCHFFLFFKLF